MFACYGVGVRMSVRLCVCVSVFVGIFMCVSECVKLSKIPYAERVELQWRTTHSQSRSQRRRRHQRQSRKCLVAVGGLRDGWVCGLVGCWSLALLLPLQMTARRRSANLMERRGEAVKVG